MKPIETMYAGTLFRSRLEARWAVFFDELDIEWEYEPEGYLVGLNERPYLPDFYLPGNDIHVEVKGSEQHLDRGLLCDAIDYNDVCANGLLVLGPIPRPQKRWLPAHPLLKWHKGVVLEWARFDLGVVIRAYNSYKYATYFGTGTGGGDADYQAPLLTPTQGFQIPEGFTHLVSAAYAAARSARFEHEYREVWRSTATPTN